MPLQLSPVGDTPLQFFFSLKYAILYVSNSFGPTCRRICTYPNTLSISLLSLTYGPHVSSFSSYFPNLVTGRGRRRSCLSPQQLLRRSSSGRRRTFGQSSSRRRRSLRLKLLLASLLAPAGAPPPPPLSSQSTRASPPAPPSSSAGAGSRQRRGFRARAHPSRHRGARAWVSARRGVQPSMASPAESQASQSAATCSPRALLVKFQPRRTSACAAAAAAERDDGDRRSLLTCAGFSGAYCCSWRGGRARSPWREAAVTGAGAWA